MNRVIGFMEVKLQEDRPVVFGADFMEDLVKDQHPIQNEPALDEGGLVGVGDRVRKKGHPIGVPFGQDPEDHVNHGDRAKLADVRGPRYLWDEGNDPIVHTPKVHGPRERRGPRPLV